MMKLYQMDSKIASLFIFCRLRKECFSMGNYPVFSNVGSLCGGEGGG